MKTCAAWQSSVRAVKWSVHSSYERNPCILLLYPLHLTVICNGLSPCFVAKKTGFKIALIAPLSD